MFFIWPNAITKLHFQCVSCGSKVSYRKALVCLHREPSLDNVMSILQFWTAGFWMRLYWPYTSGTVLFPPLSLHEAMAKFGWCCTEKPALFTCHPLLVWIGSPFWALVVSFYRSRGQLAGYSECKECLFYFLYPTPVLKPFPCPALDQHASNILKKLVACVCFFVFRGWILILHVKDLK